MTIARFVAKSAFRNKRRSLLTVASIGSRGRACRPYDLVRWQV